MSTQVLTGLVQIVIPTPFKVGPVNCYVSTSAPITLVDTGTQWDESRRAWQAGLAELGLALEAVQRIIIKIGRAHV